MFDWGFWAVMAFSGLMAGLSWFSKDYAGLHGSIVGLGVGIGYIVGRLREREEWR